MYSFIKRHKLSTLTVLALALAAGGYLLFEKNGNGEEIKTQTLSASTLKETVTASGSVGAERETTLRFQTSGMLAWVGVKEGDFVKKGQAIASLDKRELEKNLQKELNDYLNERWDFEQEREDYDVQYEQDYNYPDVLTDELRRILQKNQHDLNNTVLDVEIKNLALRFATITTPISGIVTDIEQPYPGVNITPANAEFTIVDPTSVQFEAEVDEVDIGKIEIGQKATITLDAYPEEPIETTVREIDFESTTTKGGGTAYIVKLKLPENTDQRFKLGMNGDVEFSIKEKEGVLTVPQSAIVIKDDKPAVWTVGSDQKAKLKTLKLGTETIEKAEVLEGVGEGERVVVEGYEELEEGESINF